MMPLLTTPKGEDGFEYSGTLAPNLQARIVDINTGEDLAFNQPGELLVRGPVVSKHGSEIYII